MSCFCPSHFLLTPGCCPWSGSGCGRRPCPSMPKDRTVRGNRRPLRCRNGPGYYKHNRAHCGASVLLVLSCSKPHVPFDGSPPLSACFPTLSTSFYFKRSLRASPSFSPSPAANRHLLRRLNSLHGMQSRKASSSFGIYDGNGGHLPAPSAAFPLHDEARRRRRSRRRAERLTPVPESRRRSRQGSVELNCQAAAARARRSGSEINNA